MLLLLSSARALAGLLIQCYMYMVFDLKQAYFTAYWYRSATVAVAAKVCYAVLLAAYGAAE
jgi:hypothetical protein